MAPKSPQTGSKCFKLRQDGHQMARERPKVVPRWLKETPGRLNMAPRWPKMSPQRPQTFNCFFLPLQTLRSERPPSVAAAMKQLQQSQHCRPPRFLRPFPTLLAVGFAAKLVSFQHRGPRGPENPAVKPRFVIKLINFATDDLKMIPDSSKKVPRSPKIARWPQVGLIWSQDGPR